MNPINCIINVIMIIPRPSVSALNMSFAERYKKFWHST